MDPRVPTSSIKPKEENYAKIASSAIHHMSSGILTGMIVLNYMSNNEISIELALNGYTNRWEIILSALILGSGICNSVIYKEGKNTSDDQIHAIW